MNVYVNGEIIDSVDTSDVGDISSTGILRFARESVKTFFEFHGILDDIHAYNRALSSAEVARPLHAKRPPPTS